MSELPLHSKIFVTKKIKVMNLTLHPLFLLYYITLYHIKYLIKIDYDVESMHQKIVQVEKIVTRY